MHGTPSGRLVFLAALVSHWNTGATFFPRAQDSSGNRAAIAGYNLGQSFIWLVHTRFNVMLETGFAQSQTVVAGNHTAWTVHSSSVPASAGPTISRTAYRLCPDWHPSGSRAERE